MRISDLKKMVEFAENKYGKDIDFHVAVVIDNHDTFSVTNESLEVNGSHTVLHISGVGVGISAGGEIGIIITVETDDEA
jgi:hypothetical protein